MAGQDLRGPPGVLLAPNRPGHVADYSFHELSAVSYQPRLPDLSENQVSKTPQCRLPPADCLLPADASGVNEIPRSRLSDESAEWAALRLSDQFGKISNLNWGKNLNAK